MKNPLVRLIVAVASAIANWYVFYYAARYFGTKEPSFVATMIIGSIVIHELGHWLALERKGIRSYMIFLVILGGTGAVDSRQETKLSSSEKAGVSLAGMFGNIAAVAVAYILYRAGVWNGHDVTRVANINASLMIFNLLPFGMLDGGRFAKLLFDSVPQALDRRFANTIGAAAIMAGFVIATMGKPTIFPIVLFFALRRAASHDDPNGSSKKGAMNRGQQIAWAATYGGLICMSLVTLALTPNWI